MRQSAENFEMAFFQQWGQKLEHIQRLLVVAHVPHVLSRDVPTMLCLPALSGDPSCESVRTDRCQENKIVQVLPAGEAAKPLPRL